MYIAKSYQAFLNWTRLKLCVYVCVCVYVCKTMLTSTFCCYLKNCYINKINVVNFHYIAKRTRIKAIAFRL